MSRKLPIVTHSFDFAKFIAFSSASLATLIFSIANITVFLDKQQVLGVSVEASSGDMQIYTLREEELFWEDIVKKHPTYRDGFIELSDIKQKLGHKKEAESLLNTAKNLDPNSKYFEE